MSRFQQVPGQQPTALAIVDVDRGQGGSSVVKRAVNHRRHGERGQMPIQRRTAADGHHARKLAGRPRIVQQSLDLRDGILAGDEIALDVRVAHPAPNPLDEGVERPVLNPLIVAWQEDANRPRLRALRGVETRTDEGPLALLADEKLLFGQIAHGLVGRRLANPKHSAGLLGRQIAIPHVEASPPDIGQKRLGQGGRAVGGCVSLDHGTNPTPFGSERQKYSSP